MLQYALLSVGSKAWRSLQCPKSELRLDLVLSCGQSFRWRESGDGHWTGVMGGKVWTLTQTNDTLWYYVYASQKSPNIPMEGDMSAKSVGLQKRQKTEENGSDRDLKPTPEHCSSEEDLLRDYFQLNTKLESLYEDWCCRDAHFKQIAKIFPGVRLLRQDPVECLFSFICSSNNHISRIQGMVERLCHKLGPHLATIQDTAYHDFPSLEVLAKGDVEACLRDLGFGYRARFIQQSAQLILSSHSPGWLQELRSATYEEASSSLCSLPGVGLKVADCVCLMSLDKPGALPVDTHVWQIATRDYGYSSGKGQKTLTGKVHKDVGDFFRKLWGPYAGWAQSVMFCADLKRFQKLKDQVDVVKKEPKSEKNLKGLSKNTKKPHRSKGEKAADEVSAKRAKTETQFSKKVKEEPDV